MNKTEQLLFFNALEKAAAKRAAELKNELSSELRESGYSRQPLIVDGRKVGEAAVEYSDAGPEILEYKSRDAFEFFASHGLVDFHKVSRVLQAGWGKHFDADGETVYFKDTGEACDFLVWNEAAPRLVKVTGCKFDADMTKAERNKFTPADAFFVQSLAEGTGARLLLGGGADE